MDWRNYQFWRKKLRRLDETQTEFDVLIQGTVREIALRERITNSIRMLEGTSSYSKIISGWRDFARYTYDNGKGFFFRKRFREETYRSCMGNRKFKNQKIYSLHKY